MYLASAYPNSDLSALSMTLIAVVVACSLAAWLGLVFLADRQPRQRAGADVTRDEGHAAVWTEDQLPGQEERPAVVSEERGKR